MPFKKLKTNKIEKFIKYIGLLFNSKNLVAYIGKNGVMLCAMRRKRVLSRVFIDAANQDNIDHYKKFLNKYSNYSVSFLLDNPETELMHETVPVLQNLVKLNPVESFIAEKSKKTDIIAYNIYNVTYSRGEIWDTVIARSPYIAPYNVLLEYIVGKSFKYRGTYFLALEFEGIINFILKKIHKTKHKDDLQIFVVFTKTSGIKICFKHKSDILDQQVIEYPHDKSDEYVFGTVDQAISDKLISLKDYINSLDLKISIIVLSDEKLKRIFENAEMGGHNKILLTPQDIKYARKTKKQSPDRFVDSSLITIFNKCRVHNGYNSQLKSITKLNLIHSVIFKPFLAISFVLMVAFALSRYQIHSINQEIVDLNKKHYYLSEEYKDFRNLHPEIENISTLIEIYSLETLLAKPFPKPEDDLDNIFSHNTNHVIIKKAAWRISDFWNVNHNEYLINIDANVEYNGQVAKPGEGIKHLNNYFNDIRLMFPRYETSFNIKTDRMVNLSNRVIVPANINIFGVYEEKE